MAKPKYFLLAGLAAVLLVVLAALGVAQYARYAPAQLIPPVAVPPLFTTLPATTPPSPSPSPTASPSPQCEKVPPKTLYGSAQRDADNCIDATDQAHRACLQIILNQLQYYQCPRGCRNNIQNAQGSVDCVRVGDRITAGAVCSLTVSCVSR